MVKRDHELVPTHKALSRSDASEVLKGLGIVADNLPKILVTDPQIKKIGAKPGDIIKVERDDYGKSVSFYRQVVER